MLKIIIWILLGYLAGSCPTGYLLAKYCKKTDIRTFGSGNIGATNIGRLMGKKWAVFVAVFDMFKGGIMVLLSSFFLESPWGIGFVGMASVLGHNYPVWLGFKGGKGVATTFGVFGFFDFFNPLPAILGGCVWYLVMKKSRYVSIASIVGLFSSSFFMLLFSMPRAYFFVGIFLSVLSMSRHRGNLQRIKDGVEIKVGK